MYKYELKESEVHQAISHHWTAHFMWLPASFDVYMQYDQDVRSTHDTHIQHIQHIQHMMYPHKGRWATYRQPIDPARCPLAFGNTTS